MGGLERVMSLLAKYFHEDKGAEVHLILIGKKREVAYELPAGLIIHKPQFIFNDQRRTYDTLKTLFFLRKRVKQINPDTILSFGEYWNNLSLLSLIGLRYPVYVSDRSQPNKNLGRTHNFLRKLLYPMAKGFIAQTKEAAYVAERAGWNKNIRVIGNPIREIQGFSEIQNENIVLCVGRLIPTKHIDELIKIFAEINPTNWKLIIVGGNAKKMQLLEVYRGLVRELGMENKIVLVGESFEVDMYFAKSKIFAFTSSSEGFPNALGEAMKAGLVPIAYDCVAGPSDLIEDQANGFLVPLHQKELFKDNLAKLMKSEILRKNLGDQAKIDMGKYTLEKIGNLYYNFIKVN